VNISRICVGVDGSPASDSALRWAAEEAAAHNAELVVVHAYDWRVVGARAQVGGAVADLARTSADALVASAVALPRTFAPELNIRGEGELGAPGRVLVVASARFDHTVSG
jgi:nucleotide-binding universal stress UspA family protein